MGNHFLILKLAMGWIGLVSWVGLVPQLILGMSDGLGINCSSCSWGMKWTQMDSDKNWKGLDHLITENHCTRSTFIF